EEIELRNGCVPDARAHGRGTRAAAGGAGTTSAGSAHRRGQPRAVRRRAAEETAGLIRGTNNMRATKVIQALAGLAGLAICGSAHAIEWYFREPGSKLSADIDWLHQLVMWLIIAIFAGVFGAMFYACYAHR